MYFSITVLTLACIGIFFNQAHALAPAEPAREEIMERYQLIDFSNYEKPELDIFARALSGYYQLRDMGKLSEKQILTIIDFRKSANEKRMWIIDLATNKLLKYSLVAHGRNSGEHYAKQFSNTPNSNKSSLGFYVTGSTYIGKHGLSLKLKGMEKGINDNAESRAIVMHAADYVSESYIRKVGRLGRSLGCPAVPSETHREIISEISGGTCLFIYYPEEYYLAQTNFANSIGELAQQGSVFQF
jgi:hypothetical protein